MAGDAQQDQARLDQVTSYLGRLIGRPVSADQPVTLRSVQRAAFGAWARKQDITLQTALLNSGTAATPRQLLAGEAPTRPGNGAHEAPNILPGSPEPTGPAIMFTGIGIDIEDVTALPQADDYRAHPFFIDTFTAAEISYCIRQPDVRASFCGTWAAKEAIIKSGLYRLQTDQLNEIEIRREKTGRPHIPGGFLSISHTAGTAVAVCIALSHAHTDTVPAVIAPGRSAVAPPPPERSPRKWSPLAWFGVAILATGVILAGTSISATPTVPTRTSARSSATLVISALRRLETASPMVRTVPRPSAATSKSRESESASPSM